MTLPDRIELLRSLWEGDSLCTGYAHSSIVIELCRYAPENMTPTPQWVINHLRAQAPMWAALDEEEQDIVLHGIEVWKKLGHPRVNVVPPKAMASGS